MLHIKNIFLSYKDPILKGISFELKSGEIMGLVGKSGAGKSSLLKIIAGLVDQNEGEVIFKGKIQPLASQRLVPGHPGIEIVNQDFKLDPFHTVAENIREAILYLPNDKRERRVIKMLQLLGLKGLSNQMAKTLSGGEQQRVAIARAIAKSPSVILLDEPFAHLDARLRLKLTKYLQKIREKEGVAMLLVSHDGQDILGLSDQVCIVNKGKLSRKKNPESIYYHSNKMDSLLFGPINEIILQDKKILFRPDEFVVNNKGELKIQFESALFMGAVFNNFFTTPNGVEIILYSFEPLHDVAAIDIVKKHG